VSKSVKKEMTALKQKLAAFLVIALALMVSAPAEDKSAYDLAPPTFATETQVSAVHVPANLRDHIEMKYYPAGDMMYVYEPALKAFKADLADFIDRTSK